MATYSTERCGYCLQQHLNVESEDDENIVCPVTKQEASIRSVTLNAKLMFLQTAFGSRNWVKDEDHE